MAKNCQEHKEIVKRFCAESRIGNNLSHDQEDITQAFYHIYYCTAVCCGLLWQLLNSVEKNPEIRDWLHKWSDNPEALCFSLQTVSLQITESRESDGQ